MFEHLTENLARDPDFLDRLIPESEAAGILDLSIRTMQKYRLRGDGPRFLKISAGIRGGVKYRRRDLFAWAESRIRTSTSDPGHAAMSQP